MEMESDRSIGSGSPLSLPAWTGLGVRVLQGCAALLTVAWALGPLGGVSLSPDEGAVEGSNSTSRLFNWHPILMVLAYVVCMGEALSAYAAPALPGGAVERPARKAYHATLHSLALVLAAFGLVAALLSHSLSRPNRIPDFYSAHSVVGLVALVCFFAQAVIGFCAYVYPQASQAFRERFGFSHRFFGLFTFVVGVAAAMLGAQEKATFLQLGAKKDVRSAAMVLPALLQPLLIAIAGVVVLRVAVARAAGGGGASKGGRGDERAALFGRREEA